MEAEGAGEVGVFDAAVETEGLVAVVVDTDSEATVAVAVEVAVSMELRLPVTEEGAPVMGVAVDSG